QYFTFNARPRRMSVGYHNYVKQFQQPQQQSLAHRPLVHQLQQLGNRPLIASCSLRSLTSTAEDEGTVMDSFMESMQQYPGYSQQQQLQQQQQQQRQQQQQPPSGLAFPARQERKVSTSSITLNFTGQRPPAGPAVRQPLQHPQQHPLQHPQQHPLQHPQQQYPQQHPQSRSLGGSLPRRFSNPAPPQMARHQGPSPYAAQPPQPPQPPPPPPQPPQPPQAYGGGGANSLRLLQWLSSSSDNMMDRDVRDEVWQKLRQPASPQRQLSHSASSSTHQGLVVPQPQPMYQRFSSGGGSGGAGQPLRASASTSDIAAGVGGAGGDTQSEAGDDYFRRRLQQNLQQQQQQPGASAGRPPFELPSIRPCGCPDREPDGSSCCSSGRPTRWRPSGPPFGPTSSSCNSSNRRLRWRRPNPTSCRTTRASSSSASSSSRSRQLKTTAAATAWRWPARTTRTPPSALTNFAESNWERPRVSATVSSASSGQPASSDQPRTPGNSEADWFYSAKCIG
ncbi:hypothetical protein BOX15_Mlig022320g1, partial [Macrostomum lignano]